MASHATASPAEEAETDKPSRLVVAALGIVFGDPVTSPLYTMRECFYGTYPVAVNRAGVLGVASLMGCPDTWYWVAYTCV